MTVTSFSEDSKSYHFVTSVNPAGMVEPFVAFIKAFKLSYQNLNHDLKVCECSPETIGLYYAGTPFEHFIINEFLERFYQTTDHEAKVTMYSASERFNRGYKITMAIKAAQDYIKENCNRGDMTTDIEHIRPGDIKLDEPQLFTIFEINLIKEWLIKFG